MIILERLFLGFDFVVFGGTEGEDEEENVREKDETNLKASTLFEGVAEFDGFVDGEEDGVAEGDEGEDGDESGRLSGVDLSTGGDGSYDGEGNRNAEGVNPEVDADDAAVDVNIVDGDERFPALFAGFNEKFPPSDNEENIDGDHENAHRSDKTAEDAASGKSLVLC